MVLRPSLVGSLVPFILIRDSLAQSSLESQGLFSLKAVPTAACVGNEGEGSATFSTAYSLETSVTQLVINDNGYAEQPGAQWKICNYSST